MKLRFAVVAVILTLGMTAAAQAPSIQRDGQAFSITGWTAPASPPAGGWAPVFVIYAGQGDVPPLVGTYAVEHGSLVFHSTYPISAGVRYRAVFHPPGGGAVEQTFEVESASAAASAHVLAVYPTAAVLPSNTLRLYIYFSAPMSRGEAAARVRILDANDHALDGIFLPGEELWDPRNERLTMTFDPGRIKRGLVSNESMGPPITPGARYTLVIDRAWRDARGVSMTSAFRRSFQGGPAVRVPVDPKTWTVVSPATGTTAALVVRFARSMNYPLLQRMLQVSGPSGPLAGAVSVAREEREWRFTPRAAWAAGTYQLVAETGLEDLAGNRVGQLFDIDVFQKVTAHITTATVSVPFVVAPAARGGH